MKVHTLSIDSSQRDTSVYQNPNNYVITLENPIYNVKDIRLVSARIPTPQTSPMRPKSLILRLSSGSDEFAQTVYMGTSVDSTQKGTPHFTGHILLDDTNVLTFNGSDDPFIHRFHSGPQKIISELGLEFLYLNNGVLTPYNFGSNDHVLKFEITCSTDKLESLTKEVPEKSEVTEKIKNSEPEILYNQEVYIYIGIILFVGMMLMFLMKR